MHWRFLDEGRSALTPDDRGFAYGDGLFETIAVRRGKPRLLAAHLARLRIGSERLALRLPDSRQLEELVAATLAGAAVDRDRALVKLIASRGIGQRGYRRTGSRPCVVAGVTESPAQPAVRYREGVAVRWCRTRLGRNPALAGMKHLNRLEQVLARSEWSDDDRAEGLTLDIGGNVVCGTMSNLFLVRDGALVTPALTHAGVAGIMRGEVLRTAAALGIALELRDLSPDEVMAADEVFLTNSQFVLWPVARLGTHRWGVGALTRRIMASLQERGITEWQD